MHSLSDHKAPAKTGVRAGKAKRPALVSALFLAVKQAAPLLAFYLAPYKSLVILSTVAYALYSSSLLLLPFPGLPACLCFFSSSSQLPTIKLTCP